MLSSTNLEAEHIKKTDVKGKIKHYDLTATISKDLAVFPGDPQYTVEEISSLEHGPFCLSKIHLGNHTGTHIDFPVHVIREGKNSNDFPIDDLIGDGLIIKVPSSEKSITKNFVEKQPILENDFVFFKTANSKRSKNAEFTKEYIYIEPDAAAELLNKGAKIVGIDYISVDKYESHDLPVHRLLLSKDVLIVEGLELKDIPAGQYEFFILPTKFDALDGAPARVIARPKP